MVSIYTLTPPVDDMWRRERLYAGDILVFKQVPEVLGLVDWARELAARAFGDLDPQTAQEHLDKEAFLAVVEPFMREFTHSPKTRDLYQAMLTAIGVDAGETCMCRNTIRVQPHGTTHIDRNTAALGLHRDTWYANLYEQNNWWLPIFPLESERSLVFYPRYWHRPVANSSEGWDFHEFREARKKVDERGGTFAELKRAYPLVVATEEIDTSGEIRFILEPGDILNFSAFHLHEGVPNASTRTRFSSETRTVNLEDVVAGRGAPNLDGKGTGSSLGDFYRLSDGVNVLEALNEALAT